VEEGLQDSARENAMGTLVWLVLVEDDLGGLTLEDNREDFQEPSSCLSLHSPAVPPSPSQPQPASPPTLPPLPASPS
jgi:hypothetical protein